MHSHSSTTFVYSFGVWVICLCLNAVDAAEPKPNPVADAALKRLEETVRGSSGDRGMLAAEIREFMAKYPGTPQSVRAAVLLRQLPSALDQLDPAKIAELEKFTWQPKELVGVLGEHRGRHAAPVSSVAFSRDGKWIASGGGSLVRTWDPATMRLLSRVGHHGAVTTVCFSPDSTLLASGSSDGTVVVWTISEKGELKQRHRMSVGSRGVACVDFAPNSTHLAAACGNHETHVWNVGGAKPVDVAVLGGHDKPVSAVAYSHDGKWLATGGADKTIRLWKLVNDAPEDFAVFDGLSAAVTSLAFSPKAPILVSGIADGLLLFWRVPSNSKAVPVASCQVQKTAVNAVAFSSSGNTIGAAYSDGIVRFWTVGTRPVERGRLQGHVGSVNGLAYGLDNRLMATAGSDWMVRSWDLSTPRVTQRFEPWSHLSSANSVAFARDGDTLASGSEDTVLRLWDLTRDEPRTRNYLKGRPNEVGPITRVAYSPNGKYVAAACRNRFILQWDTSTARPLQSVTETGRHAISYLTYTPDSTFLVAGQQRYCAVYDRGDGQELRRVEATETDFHCFAMSPDGRVVLTGSGDYLRDEKGKLVTKDGRYVYTDCMLRLWDLDRARELAVDKSHEVPIYSVQFLPGSRVVYTGAYESVMRKWNIEETITADKSHEMPGILYPRILGASLDGRLLVLRHGNSSGAVILWDATQDKPLTTWSLHEAVASVAFSPDSRHLALGLTTGVVYVLRLEQLATTP